MSSHGDVYLVLLAVHRPVHRALKAIGFMDVDTRPTFHLSIKCWYYMPSFNECQVSMKKRKRKLTTSKSGKRASMLVVYFYT